MTETKLKDCDRASRFELQARFRTLAKTLKDLDALPIVESNESLDEIKEEFFNYLRYLNMSRWPTADEVEAQVDSRLADSLRAWRKGEAHKQKTAAFRIMTDAALYGLCVNRPSTAEEMLQIRGIGPRTIETYGETLLRLIRETND